MREKLPKAVADGQLGGRAVLPELHAMIGQNAPAAVDGVGLGAAGFPQQP